MASTEGQTDALGRIARRPDPVAVELPGDVARDQRRDVGRAQPPLGGRRATRQRQEYLVRRQPLEHGDGRAVRGVGGDLRPLLPQHADDRRIARAEPKPMIEIERAGSECLGAVVAELIAIDDDGRHSKNPPVRSEQLRREVRRLALTERREDIDGEIERAEQLPSATVAHRHPVLQRQESVVALER